MNHENRELQSTHPITGVSTTQAPPPLLRILRPPPPHPPTTRWERRLTTGTITLPKLWNQFTRPKFFKSPSHSTSLWRARHPLHPPTPGNRPQASTTARYLRPQNRWDMKLMTEVTKRQAAMWATYHAFKYLWKTQLPARLRTTLFRALILSVGRTGLTAFKLTFTQTQALDYTILAIARRILGGERMQQSYPS